MKKRYLIKYDQANKGGFITDDGTPYQLTLEIVWVWGLFKTTQKCIVWIPNFKNEEKMKITWDRWISERIHLP